MKNFMKIFWLILFCTAIAFSAFAQTNDPYVSVLITHSHRDGRFHFWFSNGDNLSLDRQIGDLNWQFPLAHLTNHMHRNGYVFVQKAIHTVHSTVIVLFRRRG